MFDRLTQTEEEATQLAILNTSDQIVSEFASKIITLNESSIKLERSI